MTLLPPLPRTRFGVLSGAYRAATCLRLLVLLLSGLVVPGQLVAQRQQIARLVDQEAGAGHFNGALLAVENGRVVGRHYRGFANVPFAVPVTSTTRFPIASATKLFTAILTLQLVERAQLRLEDKVGRYLPELPADCQDVTIAALLTHHSGLRNEPSAQVYAQPHTSADFVRQYVAKSSRPAPGFRYNNVDYIVLTRVLEVVTGQPYARLVRANILGPLGMHDTGLVQESRIIPNLADGYHNYTFGSGGPHDTLRHDAPLYLSNYTGAGAMYSTVDDLHKLVRGLQAHKLLTAATTANFLLRRQLTQFVDEARGYPTVGFYYNDRSFGQPCLERRGSIEGYNSLLLLSADFSKVVIILCNTDTADLEKLGDQVFRALTNNR